MDQQELQKNIALYYSKLPPKLQEVFSSMQWLETLKQISAKYTLTEPQIQTLGTETTLVLLGMVDVGEYEQTLRRDINLPPESIEKLIAEINASVINTIRPELVQTLETNTRPTTIEEKEREEELDARFSKLPKEVQDLILESNYHPTLYKIGGDYKLIIPQLVDLEKVTTDVMLGTIKGDKYEESLKNVLGLPDDKVRALAKEVTDKILSKIREKMMQIYGNVSRVGDTETQILNSAGIEIIDEKPKTVIVPEKLELTGKTEVHPILAQKLTGFSKNTVTETDHSIKSITQKSEPVADTSTRKVDPYREIPE